MTNAEFRMTNATAEPPRGVPGDLVVDEVCVDLGPPPKFEPFMPVMQSWDDLAAAAFRLEAEPPAPPVPACVEKAKLPKTRQVVRRAMTADEAEMVKAIRRCVTYPVGHWDKRFMRELPEEITERQAVQVWRIFRTYRRQITTGPQGVMSKERKEELLRVAEGVVQAMTKSEGGMTNE